MTTTPIAELAYAAYAESTGGKTFDGRDMPEWADLGEAIQAAWSAAADAARKAPEPTKAQPPLDGPLHTCPRRAEGPRYADKGEDGWQRGHSLASGYPAAGRSCSYCGSLDPDVFMRLLGEGWILGPTDKNYKAYVKRPFTADEKAAEKDRWMRSAAEARAVRDLGARDGKSDEQIAGGLEAEWASFAKMSTLDGVTVSKFYFQHLSPDQCREFVDMYNDRRAQVSGGGFYVLPFFMARTSEQTSPAL